MPETSERLLTEEEADKQCKSFLKFFAAFMSICALLIVRFA